MFASLNRIGALWSKFLVFAIVMVAGLPAGSWGHEKTDIAIYNDTFCENKGVWRDGIVAIKAMLNKYGYGYQDITPGRLNSTSALNQFKIMLFPGGWAGGYNTSIKASGFRNIRTFVSNGGGFFGICAGAYFACDVITWKPDSNAPEERYDYPLNLFKGTGKGVVPGIKDWTDPTGCASGITSGAAMVLVKIDNHILPVESPCLKMLYYGGPFFKPFSSGAQAKTFKVAATYMVPGSPADGKPAMIFFRYGKGKVFLSGIHPEISFADCRLYYDETWKVMDSIISLLLGE